MSIPMSREKPTMPRILIIEDSAHIRLLIREILEADAFTVTEAEGGRQGLELAAKEKPDCIILDLIMPDVDGLNILKSLRERGSTIPVIVVTAHMQESVRRQCLELGASGFVHKPLTRAELRHAVNKVLKLPAKDS
jgi:CheY-like chemotaxis protein